MKKDTTEFRQRFQRWKKGEKVYEAGLPIYDDGKDVYTPKKATDWKNGDAAYEPRSNNIITNTIGKLVRLVGGSYDGGKDPEDPNSGPIYYPKYEYEFEVTPSTVSAQRHENILGEQNIRNYKAMEEAARVSNAMNHASLIVSQILSAPYDLATAPEAILGLGSLAKGLWNVGKRQLKPVSKILQRPVRIAQEQPNILLDNNRVVNSSSRGVEQTVTTKPQWQLESLPGYQIKSLSADSKLGKQVSKQGTITLKNVEDWANKSDIPAIDRKLLGKVLEAHKGEKNIDYNVLRREVQKHIPQYNRVPQMEYNDYGMERLGFGPLNDSSRTSNQLAQNPAFNERYYITDNPFTGDPQFYRREFPFDEVPISEIEEFVNSNIPSEAPYELNTFTFESPGIIGNTKHYSGNPIGHSRTYTTQDEPGILHVMESQSDWAQQPDAMKAKQVPKFLERYQERKSRLEKSIEDYNRAIETGILPDGRHGNEWDIKQIKTELLPMEQERLASLNSKYEAATKQRPIEQEHMIKTYLPRQIQENLRYAAENGQTKMRYPTPETAAKIEGYSKQFGTYSSQHQTILKKYADFPKQYQKLFGKKTEVRNVMDNKGNTWYEVDVPENYLNSELKFSSSLIPIGLTTGIGLSFNNSRSINPKK